jgi:uncharacterized protein YeaO (DUF488 family)
MPTIQTKRVYESILPEDGMCILVDRIWPRGISKEKIEKGVWLKDAGPSNELRKWFNHDPARWKEFKKAYFRELDSNPEVISDFKSINSQKKQLTLLYSARDTEHNQAIALKEYLEKLLSSQ